MKILFKLLILALCLKMSIITAGEWTFVCLNTAWVYKNNVNGRWGWSSVNAGNGNAYAMAGWQGSTPKNIYLHSSYRSNGVDVVYQDIVVTNVISASTVIGVPVCGNVSRITALVKVMGQDGTTIAEANYAQF